jgi:hypothetical protein
VNPCELVAKLNAGSVRLDGGGRGGVPEYTAQDIAAAIGMVDDVLAREVFCAVWWPDGGKLVEKKLDAMIAALQFEQWRERADALVTAQIALAQASVAPPNERAMAKERAENLLDRARARMWPALSQDPYERIRTAVIIELRAPRICASCNGRGQIVIGSLIASCSACAGCGRIAVSDVQRASMLKRDESSYRQTWRSVYEWTFALVSEAESTGRAEVACRLAA